MYKTKRKKRKEKFLLELYKELKKIFNYVPEVEDIIKYIYFKKCFKCGLKKEHINKIIYKDLNYVCLNCSKEINFIIDFNY